MKIELQIPDETYETYKDNSGRRGPDALMVDNLVRFADVRDGGRWLLVPPKQRETLERLLGGKSHITGATVLVNRVQQRLGLQVGPIILELTDGQLARIGQLAEREGKKPKEFMQQVLGDVTNEVLGLVG